MTFKRISSIAALSVLVLSGFLVQPVHAQQSVDPTVGAACTSSSTNPILLAQTGYFLCRPTAFGAAAGTWQRVDPGQNSVTYAIAYNNSTLAAAAALTADVNLVALPAGALLESALLATKTTWAGTATLTASVGDSTSATKFTSTQNLQTAASSTTFVVSASAAIGSLTADTVLVHFIATTNNLTSLSAGLLWVTLNYFLPPAGQITIASLPAPAYVVGSYSGGPSGREVERRDYMRAQMERLKYLAFAPYSFAARG